MNEESLYSDSESERSETSSIFEEEETFESSTIVQSVHNDGGFDEDYDYYQDEPEADEEFLLEYNKVVKTAEEKLAICDRRLKREISVDVWCKCGKCCLEFLVNPTECQCCTEIETALNSELVLSEVGQAPKCITEHPGFAQVCLQRWSLRLAAGKYKNKAKKAYTKTANEKRFLRAVAYREFHGYLGNRRIPLPACAYHEIKKAFPSETLTGYDDDDEEDDPVGASL